MQLHVTLKSPKSDKIICMKKSRYEFYAKQPNSLTKLSSKFETRTLKDKKRTYTFYVANPNAKKNVFLLHGISGYRFDTAAIASELVKKDDVTVWIPDLPSHGESTVEKFHRFKELGQWLNDAIKITGIKPDVIASHSYGSAIVFSYIDQGFSGKETRYVLGCPTPIFSRMASFVDWAGHFLPDKLARVIYCSKLVTDFRMAISLKVKSKQAKNRLAETEWYRIEHNLMRPKIMTDMSQLLLKDSPYKIKIGTDLQKRIAVIFGSKDNVGGKRSIAFMKKCLPKSKMTVIPGPGHLIHLESIDEYVGEITDALTVL